MRTILCGLIMIVFLLTGQAAFAKGGGHKEGGSAKGPHPNENAYEHANENARFKRDENWQHPGEGHKKDKHHKHDKKHHGEHKNKDKDKDDKGDTDDKDTTTNVTENAAQ